MFESSPESGSSGISPSIFLDYGADGHLCPKEGFEICERGMRFSSRWQFSLGTQLSVAFSCQDAEGKIQRASTEGIIVDCEKVACKCYNTTLLFLELPEPLRSVLHKAAPGKIPAGIVEPQTISPVRSIRPKASY